MRRLLVLRRYGGSSRVDGLRPGIAALQAGCGHTLPSFRVHRATPPKEAAAHRRGAQPPPALSCDAQRSGGVCPAAARRRRRRRRPCRCRALQAKALHRPRQLAGNRGLRCGRRHAAWRRPQGRSRAGRCCATVRCGPSRLCCRHGRLPHHGQPALLRRRGCCRLGCCRCRLSWRGLRLWRGAACRAGPLHRENARFVRGGGRNLRAAACTTAALQAAAAAVFGQAVGRPLLLLALLVLVLLLRLGRSAARQLVLHGLQRPQVLPTREAAAVESRQGRRHRRRPGAASRGGSLRRLARV